MLEKKLQKSKEDLLQSSKIVGSLHPNGGKCTYWCECKQCRRCSKCDYTVNGLRRFEWRGDKLFCENCLWSQRKIRKKCFGCGDSFVCFSTENYDYCRNCELNRKRHILKENRCSECGDGSGLIKFPNQPLRNCKLCYLANQEIFTKHD